MNQYKDPYKPTSITDSQSFFAVFTVVSQELYLFCYIVT